MTTFVNGRLGSAVNDDISHGFFSIKKGPTDTPVCQYYCPILAYRRYIRISVYVLRCEPMLKLLFKAGKNAWTSNLKWFIIIYYYYYLTGNK